VYAAVRRVIVVFWCSGIIPDFFYRMREEKRLFFRFRKLSRSGWISFGGLEEAIPGAEGPCSREMKTSRSLITGCRVYYVWYSLDQPPCEGCPIEMASFRDITDQIIKNDQFECRLPAFQQKGICFVMVRIMEKEGLLGPESNRIKLISDR
jgi:hypothetical protein